MVLVCSGYLPQGVAQVFCVVTRALLCGCLSELNRFSVFYVVSMVHLVDLGGYQGITIGLLRCFK